MEASQRGRSLRRPRLARSILWAVIIAVAFALRAAPIASGLPYLGYIDEGHVLHHVVELLQKRTLDTGFYNYPSLPSYLMAGAVVAYAPVYYQFHGHSLWQDRQRSRESQDAGSNYYDYVSPTEIIVLARIVVLILSVATVVLAGLLGSSIGGSRAGLLALLFTALSPALVSRGAIVIVDTVATFFALATLCLCRRLQMRAAAVNVSGLWIWAFCAGVASGFSFASKYTIGAVFAAVLVTILMLPRPTGTKLRLVLISGLGLVAGSIIGMPALLWSPGEIAETVSEIARFYSAISSDVSFFRAALAPAELGLLLILLGLAGVITMLRGHGSSRAVIGWLAFAAVLVGMFIRSPFQPFRNLLPVAPLVCISAAFFIARAHVCLANRRFRRLAYFYFAPAVAVLVSLSLAVPAWHFIRQRRGLVDSRVAAVDWLQQHARPDERILVPQELAIISSEWKRVAAPPTIVPWFAAADALDGGQFDYVLTSKFDLQFAADPKSWAEYRTHWSNKLFGMSRQATFGRIPCFIIPGVWRTNDERIVILKRSAE